MFTVAGYTITHELHESANSLIYRGIRTDTNQTIILKVPYANYPTPQQISRFTREYQFTKNLNIPGIRHAIETIKLDNKPALILDYVAGVTLNEAFVEQSSSSFPDFLKAAIQIAQIVSDLHHQRIIHKDINPSNILIDPQDNTVTLIDFGIATRLTLKKPHLGNPDHLEGTLPYMSPEQSGRMNRSVDFRTDLYSLGATLYTCVVGHPPFEDDDPLALIHAHIAKLPPPPSDLIGPNSPLFTLNHEVIHALSDIMIKLLSKKAEERYQSALGLRLDLEQIAIMLDEPQTIFQLGRDDVSEQLLIPETLYGREDKIDLLLGTFEDLSKGDSAALTLVSGDAGVGKSALVSEIHPSITARRGYFIQGKFDQYQRYIPYSALTQALNQFCRLLLTEGDTTLTAWRDTIFDAVGGNGQVLIDIIPDLELVIGPQPPVPKLGPQETHNRFAIYLQGFMQAISQTEHPLVIFIDDLQWADMASLQALKTLFQTPNLTHLLVIGAYRDNEVSAGDPLLITIDEIANSGISVSTIALRPLRQEHVAQWIADTLRHDVATVRPLTDLLHEKTLGNPFFVCQFLQSLYEEELLWCEHRIGESRPDWQWDLERIRQQAMTDNVVTLMVSNISKQPIALQTTLQIAACIGNQFDVRTLAWATETSAQAAYQHIVHGIEEGFLAPLDEQSTAINVAGADVQFQGVFRFVHDRIQQAAASMLSPAEQEQVHLNIGRLLLTHTPPDEQEKAIFAVVNHLNQSRRLISDAAERLRLIELNLLAGQRASQATAYQAACGTQCSGHPRTTRLLAPGADHVRGAPRPTPLLAPAADVVSGSALPKEPFRACGTHCSGKNGDEHMLCVTALSHAKPYCQTLTLEMSSSWPALTRGTTPACPTHLPTSPSLSGISRAECLAPSPSLDVPGLRRASDRGPMEIAPGVGGHGRRTCTGRARRCQEQ